MLVMGLGRFMLSRRMVSPLGIVLFHAVCVGSLIPCMKIVKSVAGPPIGVKLKPIVVSRTDRRIEALVLLPTLLKTAAGSEMVKYVLAGCIGTIC